MPLTGCAVCHKPADTPVCLPCHVTLHRHLRDLPTLYERLEVEVTDATPVKANGTTGRHVALLIPAPILDLLSPDGPVCAPVGSWALLVAEERDVTFPKVSPTVGMRLQTLTGFLLRHLDWIEDQRWVVELAGEVTTAHRALRHAVGDDVRRWVHTRIPCPGGLDDPCDGTFRLDTLDPADPALECGTCGRRWGPEGWRNLSGALGDVPVRVDDVAAMLGLEPRQVRYWVEKGMVPNRASQPRQVRVLLDEVLEQLRRAA